MRNSDLPALAGFALVAFFSAWAPDATAQATPGRELAGTTFGRAAETASALVVVPTDLRRLGLQLLRALRRGTAAPSRRRVWVPAHCLRQTRRPGRSRTAALSVGAAAARGRG
jgi:hypothetical protein